MNSAINADQNASEFRNLKSVSKALFFFNTWFTDFFSQNIKVGGGKKTKLLKKNFFYLI